MSDEWPRVLRELGTPVKKTWWEDFRERAFNATPKGNQET